jgi:hypothetical protein
MSGSRSPSAFLVDAGTTMMWHSQSLLLLIAGFVFETAVDYLEIFSKLGGFK